MRSYDCLSYLMKSEGAAFSMLLLQDAWAVAIATLRRNQAGAEELAIIQLVESLEADVWASNAIKASVPNQAALTPLQMDTLMSLSKAIAVKVRGVSQPALNLLRKHTNTFLPTYDLGLMDNGSPIISVPMFH